ncbi:hypothetical protein FGU46_03170 [Methanobacterium sp. CWC-01]|uniref:hypothetical protein n=1 Tax=Methanobacterium aridiramus TaxID=2584467 RepID=UPI0025763398|nr:hypothetical protein [Methanobacterium sp. CWC-01]WJI09160.1 hypothetical protein FGU46_03170 [Methanobacterium sp. CWC-01]
MATTRMSNGWRLYQKGSVELVHEDEELLQFEVQSGKQMYLVEFDLQEGVARCNPCQDYEYRHQYGNSEIGLNGSFICKHIWASVFKLSELRGVNQQTSLATTPVKEVLP